MQKLIKSLSDQTTVIIDNDTNAWRPEEYITKGTEQGTKEEGRVFVTKEKIDIEHTDGLHQSTFKKLIYWQLHENEEGFEDKLQKEHRSQNSVWRSE